MEPIALYPETVHRAWSITETGDYYTLDHSGSYSSDRTYEVSRSATPARWIVFAADVRAEYLNDVGEPVLSRPATSRDSLAFTPSDLAAIGRIAIPISEVYDPATGTSTDRAWAATTGTEPPAWQTLAELRDMLEAIALDLPEEEYEPAN